MLSLNDLESAAPLSEEMVKTEFISGDSVSIALFTIPCNVDLGPILIDKLQPIRSLES